MTRSFFLRLAAGVGGGGGGRGGGGRGRASGCFARLTWTGHLMICL